MKLWHLHPNPNRPGIGVRGEDPWEPSYDKTFDFVVRAEDEQSARLLVTSQKEQWGGGELPLTGDEDRHWLGKDFPFRESSVWLDPTLTTCEELTADGEAKVIVINNRRS